MRSLGDPQTFTRGVGEPETASYPALLAFLLATARDAYKDARERRQRERAVMQAVREEVRANRDVLENNQNLVETELALLKEGKSLINPLDPLETGFWDMVKSNFRARSPRTMRR